MFLILHIFTIITLRSFQTFSLPLSLERPVLSAVFGFPTLSRILTEQSQRHTMSNAVFPIVYLKSVMSLRCQIKNTAAFSCQQLNILRQTYTLSKKKTTTVRKASIYDSLFPHRYFKSKWCNWRLELPHSSTPPSTAPRSLTLTLAPLYRMSRLLFVVMVLTLVDRRLTSVTETSLSPSLYGSFLSLCFSSLSCVPLNYLSPHSFQIPVPKVWLQCCRGFDFHMLCFAKWVLCLLGDQC